MNEYSFRFLGDDWDFFVRYDKKKQRLRVIYNGKCVYVVTYNGNVCLRRKLQRKMTLHWKLQRKKNTTQKRK